MGFSYSQTIGELIYALTVCQVDISIAVITLSQHSHHPAQIHYEAVKQVVAYLNATKRDGLTYWRPQPRMDLPIASDPTPISAPSQLYKFDDQWNALEITGSCDTTWALDRTERRSMGGIVMMLAGAAVYYRTRLQPTIAQSLTEAKFTNMAGAGKAALYLTAFKLLPHIWARKGVLFLRGCISLKNRSHRPLLRASTSPFKSTCLFTRLKEVPAALYGSHLRC
jgi:hypothetical protein